MTLNPSDGRMFYTSQKTIEYHSAGVYPIVLSDMEDVDSVKSSAFIKINPIDVLQNYELTRLISNVGVWTNFAALIIEVTASIRMWKRS